jgi:hypothetical protein
MSDEQRDVLDDQERRRLFVVAAAVIALAATGISLLPERAPRREANPTAPPAHRATATNVVGGVPAQRKATPAPRAPLLMQDLAPREIRRALATARVFVRAYLRFEVGQGGRKVRGTLRRTTTPAFGRRLLEAPPRMPARGSVTRGVLDRIDPTDDPNAPAVRVAAMVQRGNVVSSLPIRLRRSGDAWRVHAMG